MPNLGDFKIDEARRDCKRLQRLKNLDNRLLQSQAKRLETPIDPDLPPSSELEGGFEPTLTAISKKQLRQMTPICIRA